MRSSNVSLNTSVLHNLTYTMILHPIAGALALFAMIFGLLGVCIASRTATVLMGVSAFLAAVVTLVVFVIDMVLWNILKNRIQAAGYQAMLVSTSPVFAILSRRINMC